MTRTKIPYIEAYQARPNYKTSVPPKNLLSLDSEWDKDQHIYVWCVYGHIYHQKGLYKGDIEKIIKKTFFKKEEVVDFLFGQPWERTFLCGMNLLADVVPLRYDGGFDWELMFSNTQFISASDPNDKKGLKLLDLYNFFPGKGLEEIGEDFCPGVYDPVHQCEEVGKERMIKACMTHAKTAVLIMEQLQARINVIKVKAQEPGGGNVEIPGSNLEITPAYTAQELHRRVFLPKKDSIHGGVIVNKLGDKEKLFHFEAYFGGRTENFCRNSIMYNVAGIDVNSMYPKVMLNIFPDMNTYKEVEPEQSTLDFLKTYMTYYEGVATVLIQLEKGLLPIPLVHKILDGKLCFVEGTWKGTFTFTLLREALKHGYKILSVDKIGYCTITKEPFFRDYVVSLYALKQDPKYKKVAKLLLNALYGKFAQKRNESSGWQHVSVDEVKNTFEIYDEDTLTEDELNNSDKKYSVRDLNGLWFIYVKPTPIEERGFSPKAFPMIAAYVTDYARILIFKVLILLGIEAVYYCDTDSIYCDMFKLGELYKNNKIEIHPTNLGAWDIEHWDCELEVRGLKYYRVLDYNYDFSDEPELGIKHHYTIRGVPKKLQSQHWKNKSTPTLVRRVKYASSIRTKTSFGSEYTTSKTDHNPDSKRTFVSNTKSFPYYVGE